jgi:hypothetical protein
VQNVEPGFQIVTSRKRTPRAAYNGCRFGFVCAALPVCAPFSCRPSRVVPRAPSRSCSAPCNGPLATARSQRPARNGPLATARSQRPARNGPSAPAYFQRFPRSGPNAAAGRCACLQAGAAFRPVLPSGRCCILDCVRAGPCHVGPCGGSRRRSCTRILCAATGAPQGAENDGSEGGSRRPPNTTPDGSVGPLCGRTCKRAQLRPRLPPNAPAFSRSAALAFARARHSPASVYTCSSPVPACAGGAAAPGRREARHCDHQTTQA